MYVRLPLFLSRDVIMKKRTFKLSNFVNLGAALLIIGGLVLGFNSFINYWRNRHVQTVSAAHAFDTHSDAPAPVQRIAGHPVTLQIPALNIDLAVANGYYNATSKSWTLSSDKAHYATITPEPNNQEGNTFIYGHNRRQVFASLSKIKPGDEVVLKTDNNHTFTYKFVSSYETNPNDDSLFNYRGAPILTLQTCSGLWYQNRQLFRFDLEKAA